MSKSRITVQISDHFVVECYVNFKKSRSHTHTLTYRKYRNIDSERFSSDLLSATQYVDSITDFNTSVHSVLDTHAPLTSRVVTERNHQTELIEYNSNGLNQIIHHVIGNAVMNTQPCVTNLGCVLDVSF